jgi:hypothetical protein
MVSEILRLSGGLGLSGSVDMNVMALLERLDGSRTLRAAVEDAAEILGAEPSKAMGPAVGLVKHLLRTGFLQWAC